MILDLELKELRNIIAAVKESYRMDFGDYALSSFKRRIIRILEVFKIKSSEELIMRIQTDRLFFEKFVKEVTVNTTEMFRDPSFWRKVRDEIIPLFDKNGTIRIWHAACSSGEEVYSMAILLKEAGLLEKTVMFATDLNEDVLKTARTGIYSQRNMDINTSNYERFGGKNKLSDYYTLSNDNAHFNNNLIKGVNFRIHDLSKNELFSKFDLIVCRNVLIYFNFELQDRVVKQFDDSLYKGGVLGIGSKETIVWCKSAKKFSTISVEEKIYRKIGD
jgi:chemotaxis protein methyltransferase CheR